jgi:hypothetical protein
MRGDLSAKYGLTCPLNVGGDFNSDEQIIGVECFSDNMRGELTSKY